MLDFNDADGAPLPDRSAQRDAIRADLIARIEPVLSVLFPAGKKRKGLFLIGDVLGSPGDSLEVVLGGDKVGLWTDRATGDGGDLFDLIAAARSIDPVADFPRLLDAAADLAGRAPAAPRKPSRKEAPVDDLGPATAKWDCFGFWLWTGSGTYEGHRLIAWQQQWHHSFWDAGGNQYELTAHAAAPWAVTGARCTIRVDAKRGNDGIWQYRVSDNDGIVWEGYKRHYARFRPSIYGYGLTLRVHRVSGGVPSALPDAPSPHYRALPAVVARTQPVPDLAGLLRYSHRAFHRLAGTRNHYYAGDHQITGTVQEKGIPDDRPVARRVLLFDERTHVVVGETWSDPATGAYCFDKISAVPRYVVIAYDYKHNFRAVIADNLRAQPMQGPA